MIPPSVTQKTNINPVMERITKSFSGKVFLVIFSYDVCIIFQPSNGAMGIKLTIAVEKLMDNNQLNKIKEFGGD